MDYGQVYLMLQVFHLSMGVPGTDYIRAKALMDLSNVDASLAPQPVTATMEVSEDSDDKEERRV